MAVRSLKKPSNPELSRKNLSHGVAVYIGQSILATLILVRQLLVIDTQQMQHRSVEIMYVYGVVSNVVAKVVSATVDVTTFHTGSGKQ